MLKPNGTIAGRFAIGDPASGMQLVNADELPTGVVLHNGDADGALVISNVSTGIYKYTGTLGAYLAGASVGIQINALIGGKSYALPISLDTIEKFSATDLAGDVTTPYVVATHGLSEVAPVGDIANAVHNDIITNRSVPNSFAVRVARLPDVDAGDYGGLPTVDANNLVAGIQGTLNTLDDLPDIVANAVLEELVTDHTTANSLGSQSRSRYWAKMRYVGGALSNQYRGIRFYKDDDPLDSGVTNPMISVTSADDGTVLVSERELQQAGSSHLWKLDTTAPLLAVQNKVYAVRLKATIDGQVRVFEDDIVGAV